MSMSNQRGNGSSSRKSYFNIVTKVRLFHLCAFMAIAAPEGSKPQCTPARSTDDTHASRLPPEGSCIDKDRDIRHQLGRLVADTQQTIDSHLTLFRGGIMATVAVSIVTSVKLSGVLKRINTIEEIPLWHFARRKKLRVRMIHHSRRDPSIFYVYHTPLFRRLVLNDVMPPNLVDCAHKKKRESDLLAVRLFGVQVDENANEWVWSNLISSRRYLTVQLLRRIDIEGSESVAICNIALRRPPLRRDLAHFLASYGLAECVPENLDKFDNESELAMSFLANRLRKLQAAQKHAQAMQYGIWNEWQEAKLSDRVISAGKRVTTKGVKKLIDTIRQ